MDFVYVTLKNFFSPLGANCNSLLRIISRLAIKLRNIHLEGKAVDLLPAIELESPSGVEVNASVIWLHGLGADGSDFAPIVPQMALSDTYGIRFIFPHAPSIPVSINNGYVMPAWYDIKQIDVDRHADEEQIRQSAGWIHALIERELERGVDSSRIIIAGFSQGGAVSYEAALTYQQPLEEQLLWIMQ